MVAPAKIWLRRMTTAVQELQHAKVPNPLDEQTLTNEIEDIALGLLRTFGIEFTIFSGDDGAVLRKSEEHPHGDLSFRGELAKAVANRSEPAFLGEEDPLLVFALPIPLSTGQVIVAVATFVTREICGHDDVGRVAETIGISPAKTLDWVKQQEPWTGRQLNAVGQTVLEKHLAQQQAGKLSIEVEKVSDNLASTYEEISVLYGVTRNLQLSSSDEELGRLALDWLTDVIPAQGMAIEFMPSEHAEEISHKARRSPVLLTAGECLLDADDLERLQQDLDLNVNNGPVVLNKSTTSKSDWPFPQVKQLIIVPLAQAGNIYGWLSAVNHTNDGEFGTVEASLLSSVGAVLGIHSGNIDLYRKQSDFLAQMVRALTSAIDAKDPYTCGHSDRVARLSVRLGHQLGCDVQTLNQLYMGGLLHDIGKIGIDDNVLRKPGRLTPAEFEHIKLHPELGYNILRDVKQLQDVLPLVLHHHEAWDGSGYPHGLAGSDIPLLARICAVADAFDAMSSDRPYRQGMADDKVNAIFRAGSGEQWDADVVDAFFAAREDIYKICGEHRADLSLDVQRWL